MLAGDAFSRWLGVELVALRPGACTLRMSVRARWRTGSASAMAG
jgi:hypothetical protein